MQRGFMAHHGGTFSEGSGNCCACCNRYSCNASSVAVAVEVSNKHSSGPEEITITV